MILVALCAALGLGVVVVRSLVRQAMADPEFLRWESVTRVQLSREAAQRASDTVAAPRSWG